MCSREGNLERGSYNLEGSEEGRRDRSNVINDRSDRVTGNQKTGGQIGRWRGVTDGC